MRQRRGEHPSSLSARVPQGVQVLYRQGTISEIVASKDAIEVSGSAIDGVVGVIIDIDGQHHLAETFKARSALDHKVGVCKE